MRTLFLILALAASAFTQGPTIDELKAKAKKMKVDGEVFFAYDKFRDQGMVISKPRNLVGDWESVGAIMATGGLNRSGTARVIMIALEHRFNGQRLDATADRFFLMFDTMNANHMFLKGSRTLFVIFDGERMQLEPLGHDSDVKGGVMSGPRVEEKLGYMLNREQAARLASAKKVEMLVGGNEKPREIKPNILKSWQAVLDVTKLEQ